MSRMDDQRKAMNERQQQISLWLAGILTIAGLALFAFSSYIIFFLQNGEANIVDKFLFPTMGMMFIANLIGFLLIRRSLTLRGTWIVFTVSLIAIPILATLILKNTYLITVLTTAIFGYIFWAYVFPEPDGRRAIILASGAVLAILVVELWNPAFRVESTLNAPPFGAGVIALAGLGLISFIIRRALSGNIRSKIVAGILITGGVSIAVLTYFAINRSGRLLNSLLDRVKVSVNLLAEEQLINTVSSEASRANASFETAITQTSSLASQLELLQEQKNVLGAGTYWNAATGMFQLSSGQYSSNIFTPRSVFIPSTLDLDEGLIRELNVTAYLDFSAPFVLENNPQITSIYFTNLNGIITYYPNIRLGASLPHDFDATTENTFQIATPLVDPDRLPRWSFPRRDPISEGLIVSVSAPVYFKDSFQGVMTADLNLDKIEEETSAIHVGSTGYAFLIDNDGHVIAMPPAGYQFFELQPESLDLNQESQLTILNSNSAHEIQQITNRMVAGENGIFSINKDGINTFIAFSPIAENEFSLGVIVPVEELTQPIAATQNEINSQVQIALRSAAIILIVLLAGAILVSLGLGQVIAAPLLRLTRTANQILEGNLTARAEITTSDEFGTLAQAFNAMTSQLGEALAGLEHTVQERTSELYISNQNNERRAKQFQSISQVTRAISSTLDLESLLTQITTVISREFGFYHIGVFLLDASRESAILSAANSEGGQTMLARQHRLKVGEKGLVGFVSSTGKPRVALDTGADAVFFNNPDLPQTRSEIALPLRVGLTIIGVLDVQSTESGAFSPEDISILSTLADQVSIAIQNARQNEETRRALSESETLSRQFVQSEWKQFTGRKNIIGIHHTGAKATLLYNRGGKGNSQPNDGIDQLSPKGKGAVLSLPIKLRGEIIGSVDAQAPNNRQWDQDEIDIVTAIIERAAIAMESSRLLTESQKRAAKERAIGEISAKISAQTEIEDLLKTAAQELTRTLPGTEIAIQFRKDETE